MKQKKPSTAKLSEDDVKRIREASSAAADNALQTMEDTQAALVMLLI